MMSMGYTSEMVMSATDTINRENRLNDKIKDLAQRCEAMELVVAFLNDSLTKTTARLDALEGNKNTANNDNDENDLRQVIQEFGNAVTTFVKAKVQSNTVAYENKTGDWMKDIEGTEISIKKGTLVRLFYPQLSNEDGSKLFMNAIICDPETMDVTNLWLQIYSNEACHLDKFSI